MFFISSDVSFVFYAKSIDADLIYAADPRLPYISILNFLIKFYRFFTVVSAVPTCYSSNSKYQSFLSYSEAGAYSISMDPLP
jgi:hypothetical protein